MKDGERYRFGIDGIRSKSPSVGSIVPGLAKSARPGHPQCGSVSEVKSPGHPPQQADQALIPTEKFAQQEEKIINGELQADKKKQ